MGYETMTSNQAAETKEAASAVGSSFQQDQTVEIRTDDITGGRTTTRLRDSWPIWSGSQMTIRHTGEEIPG